MKLVLSLVSSLLTGVCGSFGLLMKTYIVWVFFLFVISEVLVA